MKEANGGSFRGSGIRQNSLFHRFCGRGLREWSGVQPRFHLKMFAFSDVDGTRKCGLSAVSAFPPSDCCVRILHFVGEIATLFPISRPAISKHLRILESAHLVVAQVRGSRHLFRLDPSGFEAARTWLESFWDEALSQFAELANRRESP